MFAYAAKSYREEKKILRLGNRAGLTGKGVGALAANCIMGD